MKSNFSIVLISSSSTHIYPDNRASNFTNQLPFELRLEGAFSVGVQSMYYPREKVSKRSRRSLADETGNLQLPPTIFHVDESLRLPEIVSRRDRVAQSQKESVPPRPIEIQGVSEDVNRIGDDEFIPAVKGRAGSGDFVTGPTLQGRHDGESSGELIPTTELEGRSDDVNAEETAPALVGRPADENPAAFPANMIEGRPRGKEAGKSIPATVLEGRPEEEKSEEIVPVPTLQGRPEKDGTGELFPVPTLEEESQGSIVVEGKNLGARPVELIPEPWLGASRSGIHLGTQTYVTPQYAADIFLPPRFLCVYSNITSTCIVGDQLLDLLAIIPVSDNGVFAPFDIMKHRVTQSRVSEISVRISDEYGRPISGDGEVVIVLAFTLIQ